MIVSISGVSVVDKGKYKAAEVSFNKDGKDEKRQIVSFGESEPAFNALAALKTFPANVKVSMVKKGQYWNWTGIEVVGSGASETTAKTAGKVTGSNYETPAERARRQVYIVRQSSGTLALAFLKHNLGDKKISMTELIDTAKAIEAYVFEQTEPEIS